MDNESFKIPQKPETKKRHYIFIPCKTDECGMKLEWDNDYDAPIDGAWNWWMDKDGNVEYARMKEDAYDHFFPSPEHLNLQNSTWEVQSLAGYFKEVIDTKEQLTEKLVKSLCPDDIFTLPGMILTREELEAICLLPKEDEEEDKK
jgi:hypothetical protein